MSLGSRPSLRTISLEMTGSETGVVSLRTAFTDADGTFDPNEAIAGVQAQSEFSNYAHRYITADISEWRPTNAQQSKTVNCLSNYNSGETLTAEANDDFITLNPTSGMYGDFSFTIEVEANTSGVDRSAQVFVKRGTNEVLEIYIYQYA